MERLGRLATVLTLVLLAGALVLTFGPRPSPTPATTPCRSRRSRARSTRRASPAGLVGFELGFVSTAYVGIPSECREEPFTLEGSTGSDFDVCFYKDQKEQGCYRTFLDEEGTIPRKGSRSEIYLWAGAAGEYHLAGLDA